MIIQELRKMVYPIIASEFNEERTRVSNLLSHLKFSYLQQETTFERIIYEPLISLILQGSKETIWNDKTFKIGTGDCLCICHDMPLISRVVEYPYMSIVFRVDINILRSLYDDIKDVPFSSFDNKAVEVHQPDNELTDALKRYLMLAQSEGDVKIMGPMIIKEIHYRLITGSFGPIFRNLVYFNSNASTISRAITFIRNNFNDRINMPELAGTLGMSSTSFYRHFKKITAISPLQYQKEIRLITARNLLLMNAKTVTDVAYQVGYESPNQFSREYSHKFGVSPKEDFNKNKIQKQNSLDIYSQT
ncbi:AraC family transcriptional regulator [Spirochaeta cellobiosiphila]|uniref:AraC family transcriptional regulator n=1 Tax=Spirochaeta cellobiosiphila TaxID=504483 RepID=UPI0003F8FCAF|nr:AraC family transcriptional regulator [Spirochaeta cellobiosiphila]